MKQVPNGSRSMDDLMPLFSLQEWWTIANRLDLSPRELQLVQGVCDGLDEPGMAARLDISTHTVRSHFERMYRKLGVTNRSGMLLRVFRTYLARRRESEFTASGAQPSALELTARPPTSRVNNSR